MIYDRLFTAPFYRASGEKGVLYYDLAWNNMLINMRKTEKQELVEKFAKLGIPERDTTSKQHEKWWSVELFHAECNSGDNCETDPRFLLKDTIMGYKFAVSEAAYTAMPQGKK